jgi:hypothetical protein
MRSLAMTAMTAALLVLAPGAAGATTTTMDTTAPADDTVPETTVPDTTVSSTTVLNVLGTGITLDVELDPTGRLSSVSLVDDASGAPADPLADPEVAHESGHKVRILLGDDATSVQVQAGGNKVDTSVRTADLADLVGDHTWSGELFGDGSGVITIPFTVSDTDGLELTTGAIDAGATGATHTDRSWTETNDDGYEAKLRIDFTRDADDARVVISVSVDLDDDDGPHARLKISAHSRLLATERPQGPADDPAVSIDGDDSDHDSGHEDRGRSEDKRQDDQDRTGEQAGNSSSKNKGQDDDDHDHDDDSGDGSGNDDSEDHSDDDDHDHDDEHGSSESDHDHDHDH